MKRLPMPSYLLHKPKTWFSIHSERNIEKEVSEMHTTEWPRSGAFRTDISSHLLSKWAIVIIQPQSWLVLNSTKKRYEQKFIILLKSRLIMSNIITEQRVFMLGSHIMIYSASRCFIHTSYVKQKPWIFGTSSPSKCFTTNPRVFQSW